MSVRPGVRLGDRYQLLTPIATGGMGQVWRAEDTTLHRVVAAKVLRSEFTGDETFLARFRAEARNTASLSHPNIASVYDYGEQVHESERLCYLIMELVDGEPLVDILARERRLSPSRTLDYLEQTAMGLAAAHREGMVHRDVKPGNLIIRPDGVLKITDFGIARAANSVALTDQGTVVGTAQYLAPEQAEGKPAIPASDIYALGVVGYECLAGVRPFDGDNSVAIALSQIRDTPRPLPADVPAHIRRLIELTMAKNPLARYADGTAYTTAIKQVRSGAAPTPPPRLQPAGPPGPPLAGPPAPQTAGQPGPAPMRGPGVPPGPSHYPVAPQRPDRYGVGPVPAVPPSAATGAVRPPLRQPTPNGGPPQGPQPTVVNPASSGTGSHNTMGQIPPLAGPSVATASANPDDKPAKPGSRLWIIIATAIVVVAIIVTLVIVLAQSADEPDREGMPAATSQLADSKLLPGTVADSGRAAGILMTDTLILITDTLVLITDTLCVLPEGASPEDISTRTTHGMEQSQ